MGLQSFVNGSAARKLTKNVQYYNTLSIITSNALSFVTSFYTAYKIHHLQTF